MIIMQVRKLGLCPTGRRVNLSSYGIISDHPRIYPYLRIIIKLKFCDNILGILLIPRSVIFGEITLSGHVTMNERAIALGFSLIYDSSYINLHGNIFSDH